MLLLFIRIVLFKKKHSTSPPHNITTKSTLMDRKNTKSEEINYRQILFRKWKVCINAAIPI